MSELKNQIESLLFSSGKRLSIDELARLCKEENLDAVKAALILLEKELNDKQSSLMLVQEGTSYKLTVREKYVSMVKKVVKTPEMPKSIMETLAVVAYKAPVLQSKVIKIRTNKAYRHLDELEEISFITREKKGRSKLIRLTPKFFEYFDVPPEKLKDKFHNVSALEKDMESHEKASQKTQEAIIKAAEDKTPQVQEITKDLPKLAPEIEVVGPKVGDLETYGERHKKKKKKHHKKKKEEAEEGETAISSDDAATALADKILAGMGTEAPEEAEEEKPKKKKKAKEEPQAEEAPEEPEEEVSEEEKAAADAEAAREAGRITVEKIKEQAAQTKRKKGTYAGKGVFAEGVPEDVKERIDHRVAEIVGGGKVEEGKEPTAEVPEIVPAPPEEPEEEEKEEVPAEEAPEESAKEGE